MKRAIAVIGATAASAVVFLMVTAGTAMAACDKYPPRPNCVEPASGNRNVVDNVVDAAGGGTAFTGSDVSVWMVLLGMLIVTGIAALVIARRRSVAAAHSE